MTYLKMFRLKYGELRFGKREGNPSGPVVTRKLSPEEYAEIIRKYGPPRQTKNKGLRQPSFLDIYQKTNRTGRRG